MKAPQASSLTTGAGVSIDLAAVVKAYHSARGVSVRALDGISLHILPGEATAVVGTSGSGKSTLLHLIGGMDAADEGTVTVDGVALGALSGRRLASYRRRVGFVFQRFHLLPALSAVDNTIAPVLPFRTSFDKRARARELLTAVGLGNRLHHLPSQLSGGEQQRVAVARALINDPGILLADEPTGNLDSKTGTEVMDLLSRIHRERAITMVVATHDSGVAARMSRVVRLTDGRLAGDGHPSG